MSREVVEQAVQALDKLLDDDVIQVRPSDRERFMDEWRGAMNLLGQTGTQAEAETWVKCSDELPKIVMKNLHWACDVRSGRMELLNPSDIEIGFKHDTLTHWLPSVFHRPALPKGDAQ